MQHIRWWVFWGAVVVGIPALLIDSWKSPTHEVGFKIFMLIAIAWNIAFSTYKVRCWRRERKRKTQSIQSN